MSYTLKYTGAEIDDILDRAAPGGTLDGDIAAKQDALTFDAVPTEGSTNPAESGGIYDAIQAGGATALAAYVTDTAEGSIASFSDGADNIPVKSLSATITPKQSGSGDPSPSNIRPISGYTGATIKRTGANLLNANNAPATVNYGVTYTPQADGSVVVSGTKNNSGAGGYALNAQTNIINLPKGVTLHALLEDSTYHGLQIYADGVSLNNGKDYTFTIPEDATSCYARLRVSGYYNTDISETVHPLILVDGVDAPFAPFSGQTYPIDWTDEAGTVYGGTLEYIGNGQYKIQPTHAIVDMGSLSWTYYSSSTAFYCTIADLNRANNDLYCSAYALNPHPVAEISDGQFSNKSGANNTLWFKNSAYNDATAFKSSVTGQTLCYHLATLPDPIIVSGSEVRSLLGENNIWADTGEVEVEYRADTKLYIAKVIGGGNMALSMAAPQTLSQSRVDILRDPEAEPDTIEEAEPEGEAPEEE